MDSYLTLTVSRGYLTQYQTAYKMDTVIENVEWDVSITFDMTVVDPGKPVTITPPEGYLNFEDVSAKG